MNFRSWVWRGLVFLLPLLPALAFSQDGLQGKRLFFTELERRLMERVESPEKESQVRFSPGHKMVAKKSKPKVVVDLHYRGSVVANGVVRGFWQLKKAGKDKVFSRRIIANKDNPEFSGGNESSGNFTYRDGWAEQGQTISIHKSGEI